MSASLTLAKKEILDATRSPLLILFVCGFLLALHQLFLGETFATNNLQIQGFFTSMVLLWIVFLPALTFEAWSMESRLKTIELLRALPISFAEITLGKLLARLFLLAVTLALTLPAILIFSQHAHLDWGVVITSYCGVFLVGIFGVHLGFVYSRIFKLGMTAYLATVFSLIVFMMMAHPIVMQNLPSIFHPWLETLSLDENFKPFLTGLLSVKNVLFFLGGSFILFLNLSTENFKKADLLRGFLVFVLFFVLCHSIPRAWFYDATQNHRHRLSSNTQKILQGFSDPIIAKVYFSEDMPFAAQKIRQDLLDLLLTLKHHAPHDLLIETAPTASSIDAEKARQLGIEPLTLRVVEQNGEKTQQVYMGLVLHYRDKTSVIPVMIHSPNFEYQMALALLKLTTENWPILGVMLPDDEAKKSSYSTLITFLQQFIDVLPIGNKQNHLETLGIKALLVVDPENASFELGQEIDGLLSEKIPVLLFVDRSEITDSLKQQTQNSGLENYLQKYGVTITQQLLLDDTQNLRADFDLGTSQVSLDYPFWLKAYQPEFNKNHPVTSQLEQLLLPWTHALLWNDAILKPENRTILVQSSAHSFLQEENLLSVSPQYLSQMQTLPLVQSYPIAAELRLSESQAPLFIVSDTQILKNNFLNTNYFAEATSNSHFISNLVEHVTWGNALIGLRAKSLTVVPTLSLTATQKNKMYWGLMGAEIILPTLLGLILSWQHKRTLKKFHKPA